MSRISAFSKCLTASLLCVCWAAGQSAAQSGSGIVSTSDSRHPRWTDGFVLTAAAPLLLSAWQVAIPNVPDANAPRGWREFYEGHRVLVLGWSGLVALLCGIIVALVLSMIRGREAESALRTSQAQLQRAQKLAHLGSWERTLDTGKLVWSPEVYHIHGLDPRTFTPDFEKLLGLMHPEDRPRIEEIIRNADGDNRSRSMEYRIIRPGGQVRFVRSYGEWVVGAEGKPQIVGTVQDITELKEMEEQFRHVQRVESVGNLAGGIAHDFNNLLTVINGYSQMLLSRMEPGSVEHAQLAEIHSAGERGALLTRQLLSFSRKQMIQPAELSLNDVVNSTAGLLRPLLGEAIELKLQLSPDLHLVMADRAQLEQAILNLAANARDAIEAEGTFTITTHNQQIDSFQSSDHLEIHPGPYVCLEAADTGHGMDDATRERIFEPFFTTKEVGKGTGLGLSSVYGMVKQSGGHITVSSRKGGGARFRLFFPALTKQSPPPVVAGDGERLILLVDDDAQVREFTATALPADEFRVLSCGSGQEALLAVSQLETPPALLITDVRMPEMGGVELARQLTERFKSLRVLYISGYATDSRDVLGVGQAEHGFLPKPFLPRELLDRVRLMLGEPRQPL
jgi:PAS domain S-box-containing protein